MTATTRASANPFTVTNLNDSGPGSLRQAITDANAANGGTVDATGVSGTIDLLTELPLLASNLTINGPGAAKLTVERTSAINTPTFPVFTTFFGKTITLNGLTIKNGKADFGGGIYIDSGLVTINNCIIGNNSGLSGGVYIRSGIVIISNCLIANNSGSLGGGIANYGNLTLNNSTVVNNTAVLGGGIHNMGIMSVNNSTIANNSASIEGGGIDTAGPFTVTLSNSTVANNSAPTGGGIVNYGIVTLSNLTIANNSSPVGGGIANYNGATVYLQSSIVAKNIGTIPDVSGNFTTLGNNLIGDPSGSSGSDISKGDLSNVDPLFQLDGMGKPLLANNGGPTQTIALLPGSPAIDHGKNPLALTTDQRGPGFVRTFDDPTVSNGLGDGTDIGAFELQPSFDLCLQDDSNGNLIQINTTTGDYQFTNCGGLTIGGTGTLTKRGSTIALQHNAADRRVLASVDTSSKRATASVQLLSQGRMFSITDRNITNNTCACR